MRILIKLFIVLSVVALAVGAVFGESLAESLLTTLPIFLPVAYMSHVIFYAYDVQKEYVALYRDVPENCRFRYPWLLASAVALLSMILALSMGGADVFTTASILLVVMIGYVMDLRVKFTASTALICKKVVSLVRPI